METKHFEAELINSRKILYAKALALFRDAGRAEDVVQDTMLKALTNKDKFSEGTNLRGWLYTILKNTFINAYNRSAKHPVYLRESFSDHHVESQQRVEANGGVANIKMEEIQRALANIDEKFSKAFMMHFEGYKYEEIAEEMQLPLGTIKTRIHKARLMLQEQLKELR